MILKIVAVLLFMACPVLGIVSYEFCQQGNWLMTYLASALSVITVLLGWLALSMQSGGKVII